MDNFDSYNVLLVIATNIPVLLGSHMSHCNMLLQHCFYAPLGGFIMLDLLILFHCIAYIFYFILLFCIEFMQALEWHLSA